MRNFLASLLVLLIISCSAASRSTKLDSSTPIEAIPYVECSLTPKVVDSKTEINALKNLWGLSFAQAYHRIHINYDSLSIRPVRLRNQEHIKSKVKEVFPKIEMVHSEKLENMNYLQQMFPSSDIKWYSRKSSNVQKLTEKGKGNKQLYIEVVTYRTKDRIKPRWENKVSIFVFDLELYKLQYLNEYHFECDPRDSIALKKVIDYGLNLLKAVSSN
ncbi:hypothetical protein [Flagellimonas sp.]|uniref:hypothetical protein n=1 Tax=Flagellimonas sp. TaxID=2058762 RepID=UPI003B5B261D